MATLATIAPFGFSDLNPRTLLPLYRQLGCTTLQYYRNTRNPPRLEEVTALANDLGMAFDSIHGVFGPEHDPSSPDEPTRQFAMRTYREEGELCLKLGGAGVVVHPAPMAIDPSILTERTWQIRVDPMRRSIEQLARIGEKLGVVYLIENIPGNYYFGADPVLLARMIRVMNSKWVRMCFDTGHANMTSRSSPDKDLEACLDVTTYLHVNDNDGQIDSHLFPGAGTCPWDSYATQIAKLPDETPAMLELFYSEEEIKLQIAAGLAEKLAKWMGTGVKSF